MTRTLLAAAAAATAFVALPAAAKDAEQHTMTRDGQTYTYTAVDKGNYTVLQGVSQPGDHNFRLVVRNNQVRGYSDGTYVSFTAPKAMVGGEIAAAQ